MDVEIQAEIWQRLARGASLSDLTGTTTAGYVDLRGLEVPKFSTQGKWNIGPIGGAFLTSTTEIRSAKWKGLDFSGSDLSSLRLFGVEIIGCIFDRCRCRDWRLWESEVSRSTFISADLRGSALGGIRGDRWNQYVGVDWSKADLRDTSYTSASFADCNFAQARLAAVDFGGSRFVRCKFAGELREVTFSRVGWGGEGLPPNEMIDVDFSDARLRFVEFRELDLETVRWPRDSDHVIVPRYRELLKKAVSTFDARKDRGAQGLAAYLATYQEWCGPNQQTGIFHRDDLLEAGGARAAAEFIEMVKAESDSDG